MSVPTPSDPTAVLIAHVRAGEEVAREYLLARYLPVLRHWARGRVPDRARGMNDTDDFVQVALVKVLNRLDGLRIEREGAFLTYLRQTLLNALRDDLRLSVNRVPRVPVDDEQPSDDSPVNHVIDAEVAEAYEAALGTLTAEQQEAVVLRLEFQMSYPEIATAIGAESADAARMRVVRGVSHLAKALEAHR